MSVLPGAIIGELLERLNAERRRVVLDGFEPHADEWSRTWTGRRAGAARGRNGAAEADILERIVDDLRIQEPGQPTAAEIVIILTSAIRREPERAAIIVDAMLTDYPKLAVVIVATALRVCPGLRRDILATARRHRPFSKHPFILGILLALVAKVLADNGAEAAESFEGLETPSEVLAALGRHYASARPLSNDGQGRGGNRVAGFGPLVTPAFVATVLAAGDAMSRTLPADAAHGAEAGARTGPAGEAEGEAGPADQSAVQLDGGEDGDRLQSSARREETLEAPDGPAPAAAMVERADEDVASVPPPPDLPRAMAAAAPVAQGATDVAAAAAAATDPDAPAPGEAAAAEVFDLVLQRLAGTDGDGLPVDALLRELAAVLAGDMEQAGADDVGVAAEPEPGPVERHAGLDVLFADDAVVGASGPDGHSPAMQSAAVPADASPIIASPVSADIVDIVVPGGTVVAELDVGVGDTAEADIGTGIAVLDGTTVAEVLLEVQATAGEVAIQATGDVELLGGEGAVDLELGAAAAIGDDIAAGLATDLTLLGQDSLANVEVGAQATVGGVIVETVADLELLGDQGVADLELAAAATIGDDVAAGLAADLTLLGQDSLANVEVGAQAAVGEVIVETVVDLELLGDQGVADLELAAAATIGDDVAAGLAADLTLLDPDGLANIEVAAQATVGEAAVATTADVGLLGEDAIADVELETATDIGGVAAAEVSADVELTGSGGPMVELESDIVVDALLSVDIDLSSTDGVVVELDLLPDLPPVPVVEDAVEAVETVVGAIFGGNLFGEPEPEAQEPPPAALPPPVPNPVQSVLYSLGSLFG